eukprot:1023800-Pyramimonas_sp.AAC.1
MAACSRATGARSSRMAYGSTSSTGSQRSSTRSTASRWGPWRNGHTSGLGGTVAGTMRASSVRSG